MATFQLILTILIFVILTLILGYLFWSWRKKTTGENESPNPDANTQKIANLEEKILEKVSELKVKNETTGNQFNQSLENIKKTVYEASSKINSVESVLGRDLIPNITNLKNQMNQNQGESKNLGSQIEKLNNIFINDHRRGKIGETSLNLILESMLGSNNQIVKKQHQMKNGNIVDVFLHSKRNNIPIDSKFPYSNFVKLFKLESQDSEYSRILKVLKQNVKKHISVVADKYISADDQTENAVMYIPAQALFEFIYSKDEFRDLTRFANEKKVWIAGPNILPVLLATIVSFVRDSNQRENMDRIINLLKKTASDFKRFGERWDTFNRRIEGLGKDAEQISITSKKITKGFGDIYETKDLMDRNDEMNKKAKSESIVKEN